MSTETTVTRTLPIEQIRIDGELQTRIETDDAAIDDYAHQYREGEHLPPIEVFFDGTDHWLVDGFHRILASQKAGLTEILADIRPGTFREALLYSAAVNARHGVKRSNWDKRNAVFTLLKDDEWSQWSDRQIARHCVVDNAFVSKLRKELSVDGQQIAERLAQRGGTTYAINTTNIGARPAIEVIDQPSLAGEAVVQAPMSPTDTAAEPEFEGIPEQTTIEAAEPLDPAVVTAMSAATERATKAEAWAWAVGQLDDIVLLIDPEALIPALTVDQLTGVAALEDRLTKWVERLRAARLKADAEVKE